MSEPLIHEITLKCSVAHAFEVFTRHIDLWWPPGHRRFAASSLQCEPRVGGQLTERTPAGEAFVWADVLEIDPPRQIILAWHPGKITQPTRTVLTFAARGPHAAHVNVTHTEGDAALGDQWPHRAALFDKGWSVVLPALAAFIQQERTDI